ncbi:hypothetical protein SLNWT_2534 [Streptomyces albus]|uniref:Uncharacterized protein n=1 Tax=Streptomyces albus (strain ATCC 21838 / DSM 41398 / FERM P-419 / JCM 4703 / NBRC 107858) TaxID=1081613 RepID=A0A0B5EUK2_STRA4|nr:hypothetical protein SLNWT_2534 [Streptomyces albus]AOU77221.1 hypothetical protein SLNHY_2530 [Streptomyces albus]AYN32999.1 hypothetical protein DUI70_2497 [Streptomyces albus]
MKAQNRTAEVLGITDSDSGEGRPAKVSHLNTVALTTAVGGLEPARRIGSHRETLPLTAAPPHPN